MKAVVWCMGPLLVALLVVSFACSNHNGPSARTAALLPASVPTIVPPSAGPDTYLAYCASCHGKDGKGAGPAARSLKVATPDLTGLARRNGGRFPNGQVFQVIEWGGAIASHGSREMPVWGVAFRPMNHESQKQVTARIEALTRYIDSIQQP